MNKKIFDFELAYTYLHDCIKWWKEIEEKKQKKTLLNTCTGKLY